MVSKGYRGSLCLEDFNCQAREICSQMPPPFLPSRPAWVERGSVILIDPQHRAEEQMGTTSQDPAAGVDLGGMLCERDVQKL